MPSSRQGSYRVAIGCPTAGLATRGGLDRGRIPPTHYQTGNPRSPCSKWAGRTLLQVLQKMLVVRQSIAVDACRRRAHPSVGS